MSKKPLTRALSQGIAALLTLSLAGAVAYKLVTSQPNARRGGHERKPALVEVTAVTQEDHPVIVDASGTVVPARLVELHAEVAGRVVRIGDDLEPGAFLPEGGLVAQLDASNYQVALQKARSGHDRARADLDIERGQQRIAKKELEIFEQEGAVDNPDRALRKPQLDGALATVGEAQAGLVKAQLDLSRTRLTSPFDAIVRSRSISTGSVVSESSELAMLVGTATWWIEVTVPKDRLRWLRDGEVNARVYDEAAWGRGVFRTGRVLRLGTEVVDGGRLVRVLIGVDDPLGRNEDRPPLLLGSWVRTELEGTRLAAVALDRQWVHDGNQVWVVKDQALDIREVTIAARLRDQVLVTDGLQPGEQIVTSDLPWPVQGMLLEVVPAKRKRADSK